MPNLQSCCSCSSRVDGLLTTEVNFGVNFQQLCKLHPSPHREPQLSLEGAKNWGLSDDYGVYLLWRERGTCPIHTTSHCMEAIYVGKGFARWRIVKHWKQKKITPLLPVYFSFTALSNRKAKYMEQLLLDEHRFELNKFENIGTEPLIICLEIAL